MPHSSFDVVVIGGGPAGSTVAYDLAKAGVKVALLEKEKLPRYKCCGGVVATHVDRILDFSIEPAIERRISKILITVNLANPFVTESPYPFIYLVMRDKFDAFLLKKAVSAGAVVYSETPLLDLHETAHGYVLNTRKNSIQTRYLVAADGANSITRKLSGAPRFQRLSVAIEREINGDANLLESWKDTIALDFGRLSSGYGWVFAKAHNLSIGAGGPQSVAKKLGVYCDELVRYYRERVGETDPFVSSGHYLPIRTKGERIRYGRTLLVGDAAGLVEPMTGEGIYYAMRSGQIAANTVSQALRSGDQELQRYETEIDREIQPELQIAKSLLYLLHSSPSFWVPRMMKPKHVFWRYFYRIFTGETEYQDLPKRFSLLGRIFFYLLERRLGN